MLRLTTADVDPDLRARARFLPSVPIRFALSRWLINALMRLAPAAPTPSVTVTIIPEAGGARLHRPQGDARAALLWIHGGGYVIGNARVDDSFAAATARILGIAVLSAEYRLAPRHPFPAPLEDCLAAWDWLQQHSATLGLDPARIAIGGQSAGGGLAAALVQRLHDRGGTQPIAQWLFCPMLDDRTAADRTLDDTRHFLWPNRANAIGWASYLGQAPGSPRLPPYAASSRRQSLAGLPRTWIGVGAIDLFHAEDCRYADDLRTAGVAVTLDVVPGAPHGFEAWAPDTNIARRYMARAREWLRDAFNPASEANILNR